MEINRVTRRPPGRPYQGPRTFKSVAIPDGEWPQYAELIGGRLGGTAQAVLIALIRLGYAAHAVGLAQAPPTDRAPGGM